MLSEEVEGQNERVFEKDSLERKAEAVCLQDPKQFDMFQEWTDGYVRYIYSGETRWRSHVNVSSGRDCSVP